MGAANGLPYWRLSAYYFAYFAFAGVFSTYFTLYLQSLSLSAPQIAVLMSLMQVMRLIAPNLWGWVSARTGWRMGIVRLSAFASLAGFAVFFTTSAFSGLFIAMALMAFFWSAALPLVESVTFTHLGHQAHRYGRIRVWGSVGFIASVLGVGHALDVLPIDAVLWMTALVLGGIALCALAVPDAPRQSAPRQGGEGLRAVLARAEVRALLAACFFMAVAHGAMYFFLSIHLADNGYSKGVIGWLWSLGVLAEILVFLLMPRIARRWSYRAILCFTFVAAVLRFLLLGWATDHLAALLFAQALHGLTFGAYHAAAIALINQWFTGRNQAHGQALYGSVSFGAGGMVGGLLAGFTWEVVGAGWTFTASSVFALAALACLVFGWRPGPATPAAQTAATGHAPAAVK